MAGRAFEEAHWTWRNGCKNCNTGLMIGGRGLSIDKLVHWGGIIRTEINCRGSTTRIHGLHNCGITHNSKVICLVYFVVFYLLFLFFTNVQPRWISLYALSRMVEHLVLKQIKSPNKHPRSAGSDGCCTRNVAPKPAFACCRNLGPNPVFSCCHYENNETINGIPAFNPVAVFSTVVGQKLRSLHSSLSGRV